MTDTASQGSVLNAFQRMKMRLQHMAERLTGNSEDAEDALQDAFVRLWVKHDNITSDDEACAIMSTTVHNLSIDELRRRQHIDRVDINDITLNTQNLCDDNEQSTAKERYAEVQRIIKLKLSSLQQTILKLRDYDGLDYDTIAAQLNMQPPAIRMQLSRARKIVRDTYRELHKS